jgi:hypothetical protein
MNWGERIFYVMLLFGFVYVVVDLIRTRGNPGNFPRKSRGNK